MLGYVHIRGKLWWRLAATHTSNFHVLSQLDMVMKMEHNTLTTAQKQTEREKMRRLQQECKGALELARLQIGLGGDVHWEWPDQCAAWNLDFIQKGVRELCLDTTTAAGCALGVKHPFSGKLVGQRWRIASTSKRLLDRITLSCQGGHQHHEIMNSYHTLGIPFPDALARRVC